MRWDLMYDLDDDEVAEDLTHYVDGLDDDEFAEDLMHYLDDDERRKLDDDS